MWGSLLAGGDVIAARGTHETLLNEEDEVYLRSAMTNWSFIDTRNDSMKLYNVNSKTGEFSLAVES